MTRNNDPNALGKLIRCLSLLESKTSNLYKTLSDRIELPFVSSIMLNIAQDSQKHSTILKGIGESLSKENVKAKDCEKNTGATWQAIESLQEELAHKETLSNSDLLALSERLALLESTMGEEYYLFVQLRTLELLVNEINKNYDVDLGSLKTVFTGIINDEEHHRELLGKARELIENRREKPVSVPFVKYQNPDAWIRPTE